MPPTHHPTIEGSIPTRATGETTSGPDGSSPRRRPRVDSESHSWEPGSRPDPKRLKHGPAASATLPAMSAKVKGKRPEMIDLTQQNAFRPGTGAKKLVIKNLRSACEDQKAEQYYERTRQELKDTLKAIFNGQPITSPLERLYRGVEDVCRHGQANDLYRILRDMCEGHLRTDVLQSIRNETELAALHVDTLGSVLKHWHEWEKQTATVRSIFSYLDRTYLMRERSLPSINDMTIAQFRKMTMITFEENDQSPWSQLVAGICNLVALDRHKDSQFDGALLKESIMMIHVFNMYHKGFEPIYIEDSAKYFYHFGEERSSQSLKDYILACERLLKDEDYRCNAYNFDSSTKKQLLDVAHDILIGDYSTKLLNGDSVSKLLSEREIESMKALYDLLRLSGIQAKLKKPWSSYIQDTGAVIVGDTLRGDEMVLRLLEHRRSMDLIIRDAFGGDEEFAYDLRQAFSSFMNDSKTTAGWSSGPSKIGEMIAKHIDMLLRGGLKALPKTLLSDRKDQVAAEQSGQSGTGDEEAELDRQLDQAVELFRFIEGKDAFEAFYKKDLARRLLMGRSASSDAERSMLGKLRDECGSNFTRNLEQMFKDQELAKGEMEAYKDWIENSGRKTEVDLQVMVISASAWPTYPETKLNIPPEVAEEVQRFEGWFKTKHDGRKLTWPHALANCTVKAKFPKGTKELLVSAYQAVVLVLFNTAGPEGFLSCEQISAATGLQGAELERTLQSLACAKVRPLTKHPKGKEVAISDTFSINKTFSDPKLRIKINQIQLKETKEENKATHDRIEQDRRFETQAAIVRVMKARKTMGHGELVAEVINLTKKRGPVDAAMIKREIEALIDKDYLERDGREYSYVA